MTQVQSLQPHPQARAADVDSRSLGQSLSQFGQSQVGLFSQGGPQLLLHGCRQAAGWTMAGLRRSFLLQLLSTNLLAVPPADPELLGQLPQAPAASLVRLQQFAAQIVGIGSVHHALQRSPSLP